MLKILIADDHVLVRKGIRQILLEEFSTLEIQEVNDTASLMEFATRQSWNLIISDISMPGGGGLEALSRILEINPGQRILLISVYSPDQYAVEALRSGAYGFLNKDTAPEELINAVKMILFGHKYVHPLFAEKMSDTLIEKAGLLPHELLSHTEREILMQLVAGFPIEEISKQFGLTPGEITATRQRILGKIDINTQDELIHYAKENGLLWAEERKGN